MKETSRVTPIILALCILGGAIILTLNLVYPPAPLPDDAPATDFSATRAMQDLEVIAQEPRPMGVFPSHAAARDYLLEEIRAIGLEPQVQDTFGFRLVEPGFLIGGGVENILVRLPGTHPDGAILLIAHYDSTPGGPGAGDNGSGVVTILEILRALHPSPTLRHDVIFLFTDGHEPGIIGTHAFAAQHPWFSDIKLVINIDLRGVGPLVLAHNIHGNDSWIPALSRTAGRPAYISLPSHLFPGGENDLIPFNQVGVTGVSFASTAFIQEIHTSLDRPEMVEPSAVQQAGNQLLALVRYLGDQPTLEIDAPEQTFFPVLGKLVRYHSSWAVPLGIVAGLVFLGTLWYGFVNGRLTWKGLGLGMLTFLICLVLSIGVAMLLWQGIQLIHPEYEYSSLRPHLSDDQLYTIGFILLALAMMASVVALVRKKITSLDLIAGMLVVWVLVVVTTTILVPATSYLATWVLLANSLAILLAFMVQSRKDAWFLSGIGFLASAILATLLWIPLIYIAFIGPGFTMFWMVIALAALWLGAMMPLLDWITSRKRWSLPVVSLILAVGLIVTGNFLVGRDSPPPMVNSIGYSLDAESSEAHWVAFIGGYRTDARTVEDYQVAFPESMDERQTRLLVDPIRQDYTDILPAAPPFSVLTSTAPVLTFEGPQLEVLEDEWVVDRRVVRIKVMTSMHDRVYVIIPEESPLLAITVPENERSELPPVDGWEWMLRFDGTPIEGIEMSLEFSDKGSIQILVIEEKTGLPSFPGLSTQPEPGTMPSPGEFYQGVPADFTSIHRLFEISKSSGG
ncbi:MAG: M28 family peptidase [Anaerolineales bacterium]|nr:M28 family peptidase [Anaerolineales bacterium]